MYHKTLPYKTFAWVNMIVLALLAIACILPLVHVTMVSFSDKSAAEANLVTFWPIRPTLDAYEETLSNSDFLRSFVTSVLRVVAGTGIGLVLIFLAAYPLSKERSVMKSRNVYAWYFVFTMIFSGGLVPHYMLIRYVGLMNSFWALVLPGAVNIWLMILMLNFFRTIPKDLEEAALIDGAGHFRVMLSVFLPLSMPSIATLSLYMIVNHWNAWFDGLIYLKDSSRYPMATLLQTIVVQADFSNMSIDPSSLKNLSKETVRASQIVIAAVPILLVYPLLQKYFVSGMTIGAVKE